MSIRGTFHFFAGCARESDDGFCSRRLAMPRGDKSKYTDKQERKADHIAESYESAACRRRRRNGAPGPRSTRTTPAARRPAARAEANQPAIPPRTEEAGSAALLRPLDRAPLDQPRPERRRHQGSGTPSAAQRDSRLEEFGPAWPAAMRPSHSLPKRASVLTASGVFAKFTCGPEPPTWAMMRIGLSRARPRGISPGESGARNAR